MFELLLVLGIILCVFLYTKYFKSFCASKLTVKIYFDDNRTTENGKAKLNIDMSNKKFLIIPIFKINIFINKNIILDDGSVKDGSDNEDYYTYTIVSTLLSYQRVKKIIELKPIKRGYYTFSAAATLIDIFGFSRMTFPINDCIELFVNPEPKNIREYINDSTSMHGDSIVRRWIMPDPIFYSGVRAYDSGDSFKDIDWKATAKLRELYVKKYDYTSDPSIMIFLDVYSSIHGKPYDENYVEKAISFSAALVYDSYKNKVPVGFGTNSYMRHYVKNIVMPDTSFNNYLLINDILTCMEYRSFDTFKNTMDKYVRNYMNNNIIVFIKFEMSKYLYHTAKYLSSQNCKVQIFLYKTGSININDNNIIISYLK